MSVPASLVSFPRRSFPLLGAGAGVVVWAIATLLVRPSGAAALLLLAGFVVFPLGLQLVEVLELNVRVSRLWLLVHRLRLPCALLVPLSFLSEPGYLAALCVLPWLFVTGLLAWVGGAHAWKLRRSPGVLAALVFPVVGGVWLVASRLGLRPLGLSDAIVQATAVHFHYAGFALPLLAAMVARRRPGLAAAAGVAGVLLGVPLVAAGITLTALGFRHAEGPAAWFLSAACALVAFLQARHAREMRGLAAGLLGLSSLSLLAAMVLAALYALGNFLGQPWLDIPSMVWTHGLLNAVGFALAGLAGWALEDGKMRDSSHTRQP